MNEKILVVDDEASIVDLIKLELEFEGYQVETASDGVEAVEKALAIHPDLIVLDIMLPKKNGYDVCRELSPQLGVPIILLTAKTDIIDKVLGLELGADAPRHAGHRGRQRPDARAAARQRPRRARQGGRLPVAAAATGRLDGLRHGRAAAQGRRPHGDLVP